MTDHPTIAWAGQSGATYTYYLWPIDSTLSPKQAGNYIFTRAEQTAGGGSTHHPIYIGETGEGFQERFASHEKMPRIRSAGATHVALRLNADTKARKAEETDLIQRWPTPCND